MDAVTPGAFLTALKTQMVARLAGVPALANVDVFYVPPSESALGDWIVLVREDVAESDRFATAQQRRARDETVTIPGAVQAHAMTRRGGDEAFKQAFDRAVAIVSELVHEMRDNPPAVGSQTRSVIVGSIKWTPAEVAKGGWVVRGSYELTYTSRVS